MPPLMFNLQDFHLLRWAFPDRFDYINQVNIRAATTTQQLIPRPRPGNAGRL
jgi:hypothetical protein